MKRKPKYNPRAGKNLRMMDDRILRVVGLYHGKVLFPRREESTSKGGDMSGPFFLAVAIMMVEYLVILALMHKLMSGHWINL